jgi:predicted ester cyclase
MPVEDNKALIRRIIDEGVNAGNYEVVDDLFAPDYVNHNPLPGVRTDREGVKQSFRTLRAAFPDLRAINADLVAEGDRVVVLRGFEGTHERPFLEAAPTGKHIILDVITVFRVVNGRVAERWGVLDMLGVMRQLGLLPEQGH